MINCLNSGNTDSREQRISGVVDERIANEDKRYFKKKVLWERIDESVCVMMESTNGLLIGSEPQKRIWPEGE